jgi:hypothetical protein
MMSVQAAGFDLLSPSNGVTVIGKRGGTSVIQIKWGSLKGTKEYTFVVDAKGGNFSAPVFEAPSDSSGKDTVLTITDGFIDTTLAALGVVPGDSTAVIWSVKAMDDSSNVTLANKAFDIIFKRAAITTGISDNNSKVNFAVYPNPSNGQINVAGLIGGETVRVITLDGKTIQTINNTSEKLNINLIDKGVYFVQVQNKVGISTIKIVIN